MANQSCVHISKQMCVGSGHVQTYVCVRMHIWDLGTVLSLRGLDMCICVRTWCTHRGRFMCVRVRPGPTGSGGSVDVLSSCWYLHICGMWACGCVQVRCLHTHTCTSGNPDTYRHTPAPSYRHTPLCKCVLTLVCRLPDFLSVFLCWGEATGTKCLGLLWKTEADCQTRAGTPFSAGFQCPLDGEDSLISWELPFRVRPRLGSGRTASQSAVKLS